MFTTFAKFPEFQGFGLRHVVPRGPEAAHANDNPRGLRRPAGQHRSPPPRLACRWVLVESRLECRWGVEDLDGTCVEASDGRQIPSRKSGLPHGRSRAAAPG
jgi:hypothetical protein